MARLKFAGRIKIARVDVAILQRRIIKSNGLLVSNIHAARVRICEVVRVVRYLLTFSKYAGITSFADDLLQQFTVEHVYYTSPTFSNFAGIYVLRERTIDDWTPFE